MGNINPLLNPDPNASAAHVDPEVTAPIQPGLPSNRLHVLATVVGATLGAFLAWRAYIAQGGEGMFFTTVGGVIGGLLGHEAWSHRVRLRVLGAAVGAIASLTGAQCNMCDGSVFLVPFLGALIGLLGGSIIEWVFVRRTFSGRLVP